LGLGPYRCYPCKVRIKSRSCDPSLLIPVFPRFEQSDHVGGRAFSLEIDGHTIEMGASIVHEDNYLITKMAKISNLTPTAPSGASATASGDDLFALFDGTSLVFRQSPWRIITLIKLLWRYGLQPWTYKITASQFLQQFQNIYMLQNNGTCFARPHELLKKLNFYWLTQMSFVQYIHDYLHSYSNFASEFVAAASLVNYNSANIQLNALAGLVSLLPAVDPRLYSIKEGNQKLAEGSFTAAGANVHLNSAVDEITAVGVDPGNPALQRFKITLAQGNENNTNTKFNEDFYDVVIIATPFHNHVNGARGGGGSSSGNSGAPGDGGGFLNITGVSLPTIPRREYQTTVVTIIKGAIRPTFFGLPPGPMPFSTFI
jgi:Prenylcysteine lyase